ncbi:hypothetical protein BD310DRAFT_232026 [Dichomitus squalens]|uniref:Uncharacterized protein n=1 Tax=Dichomitus squalens TaxID=114155 RepID=A0A4Q9PCB2_9APHY|nr:hypothetical protein BD310DRAFT_232026 [Dichomitus squalens]
MRTTRGPLFSSVLGISMLIRVSLASLRGRYASLKPFRLLSRQHSWILWSSRLHLPPLIRLPPIRPPFVYRVPEPLQAKRSSAKTFE